MLEPELALGSELLIADETIGGRLEELETRNEGVSLKVLPDRYLVPSEGPLPHRLLLLLKCVQRLLEQLAKGHSLGVGYFIQPLDDL
jgi:hypothetical protein